MPGTDHPVSQALRRTFSLREREQVAAEDLITLASLVGQDALLFQQRQPRLGTFRFIVFRTPGPVLYGLGLIGEEPRIDLGQPLLYLGLILLERPPGRS